MDANEIKIPWDYNEEGEVDGPWPSKKLPESILIAAALKLHSKGQKFCYHYLVEAFRTLSKDELEILST